MIMEKKPTKPSFPIRGLNNINFGFCLPEWSEQVDLMEDKVSDDTSLHNCVLPLH